MKNYRALSIAIAVTFLAAAMIAPISTAGTVNLVLDQKDNSANLTEKANSQLMVKTNSTTGFSNGLFYTLEKLFPHNYSYSMVLNSSSNHTMGNINELFHHFNSNISVNYFQMNITGKQTMANSTEFVDNYSSSMILNITGIFNGRSANLSWRHAISDSNISKWSNGNGSISVSNQKNVTSFGIYNFTVFHKSLSSWNRTYNASTNITTFTTQSSSVTQVSFFNMTSNLTIRYTSDPVYTITVHGNAIARGNSLLIENAPHSTTPYGTFTIWYIVVAVVIVAGAMVSMSFRKRRLN
ncbi:hypothetical protein OXIME_001355 [Oxyplasma meridianum]|uniref:Uncharacterized protein n=1 Tax=Oxyplasma meridianum TaxID=3073602 RepID=A0AAX4NJ00_9ARCH